MFNQTIVRIGIRYGVLSGLICFALVALLYFIGYNPFGDMGRISYLPIPIFIFLALRNYKKYIDTELNFGRGLRVGLTVAFYSALSSAMLVFVFIYLVGPDILQNHIAEMQALLEETREQQIQLMGEESYRNVYNALNSLTPSTQAADFFLWRMIVGSIFALVAAVFFRK
ncbi:DUF4199 domain-containing protein [Pontibacter anaerobius]|uniref:DUF4199 domain-containing protein n=1 Tax=Pontibacter anaerobius TaxID=2993940 RepID=A0ABT3RK06_9BACT|nr:DUF4199 domain-containing protein [Pontibacter anaerobius]MCX2742193.1 DUF4199 domain-containing protein [Pontibacter anaerobius]